MAGTLTTYGANPYYGMGYYVGRKYGPYAAKWAARRIGRAARAYMARKRRPTKRRKMGSVRAALNRLEKPFKRQDSEFNASFLPTAPQGFQMGTNITNGDLINRRDGQSICIRGLHLKLIFRNVHTVPCTVRCMLIQTRNLAAATGMVNTIYANLFKGLPGPDPTAYNTTNGDRQQIINAVNRDNITVLYQKKFRLLADNPQSMGKNYRAFSKLLKWKGKILRYRGTGFQSDDDIVPSVWFLWFFQYDDSSNANSLLQECQFVQYWCKN